MNETVLLRPEDVAELLNLPRTTVYRLLREGRIRSAKEGRRRLILREDVLEYARELVSGNAAA